LAHCFPTPRAAPVGQASAPEAMAQLATLPCCGEMIDRSFFFPHEPLRGRPLCPMCREPLSRRLFAVTAGAPRGRAARPSLRGRSQSRPRYLKYEVREESEEDRSPSRSPSPAPLSLEDQQAEADREAEQQLAACAQGLQGADAGQAEGALCGLLAATGAGKAEVVARVGGIEQTTSALRAHKEVAAVQYYGCQLLWRLMEGASEAVHERSIAVARAGGGELAAVTAREHSRNGAVQAEGCLLLMSIMRHTAGNERAAQAALQELVQALQSEEGPNERCSDKRSRVELVAQRLEEGGGAKLAKAVMRMHSEHAGIQLVGCHFLLNLIQCAEAAVQAKRRGSVASGDGLQLAAAAMRTHAGHASVQTACCNLLVELASGSEQDKAALARAGYIELATEAMKAHSQDADLLSASCSLLRLLTSANDRRVSLVVRTGCIDVVVGALRAHAKHPGVQSAGCALLMNLTVKSQERCSEVIQKGGMQIAATAIRTYTGNGPVQEAAGMLVATLQSGGTPTGGWAGALQKPAWMSGPREVRTSTFYDTRDDGRLLL